MRASARVLKGVVDIYACTSTYKSVHPPSALGREVGGAVAYVHTYARQHQLAKALKGESLGDWYKSVAG